MNIITHPIKGNNGFNAYILTDYGRGKFGLSNLEDNVYTWLSEAAYGEVLTAIQNHNDPLQAAKDAENAALEQQADSASYGHPYGLGAFGTN